VAVLSVVPCDDFGAAAQNTWNDGKDPLTPALDLNVVAERATEGVTRDSPFAKSFRDAALKSKLGVEVRHTLDTAKGVVVFLRCRERAGFPTALFSVRYDNAGFGHFELELRPRRGGGVRVVDFWTSFDSEWTSASFRRLGLLMAPAADPAATLRAKLFNDGVPFTEAHLTSMSAFNAAAREGDAKATELHFAALHPSLQKDRIVMGLRTAGTANDPEASTRAVEAFMAAFPADPSVALKAFDYHFTRKQFDACLEALDVLEHALGLDPWLEVLRARVELAAGHLSIATKHAARAVELEPWNTQDWFPALDWAVARRDHSRTSRLLDGAVKAGANFTRESLGASEAFATFMRSPEGKRWRPPPTLNAAFDATEGD